MYDSGGVNGCDTVGNGALHYVLQLMGRVWCYGERLRARYHNHLATLYLWVAGSGRWWLEGPSGQRSRTVVLLLWARLAHRT